MAPEMHCGMRSLPLKVCVCVCGRGGRGRCVGRRTIAAVVPKPSYFSLGWAPEEFPPLPLTHRSKRGLPLTPNKPSQHHRPTSLQGRKHEPGERGGGGGVRREPSAPAPARLGLFPLRGPG